jgi:hypothetical protein
MTICGIATRCLIYSDRQRSFNRKSSIFKQSGCRGCKMLVAADFKYKTADTPQQMKRMQALPQGRFIRHQAGGEVSYLYADVAGCKCVWRGDKAAYSRYKELARERKVDYKASLYESQDEELLPDVGWE